MGQCLVSGEPSLDSDLASQSKTAAVTLSHFQAEPLVANQGPLLIQLRKQQTGLLDARGLQEPIIRMIRGYLIRIANPWLATREQPAKPTTETIEQLEWMHLWLDLRAGFGGV